MTKRSTSPTSAPSPTSTPLPSALRETLRHFRQTPLGDGTQFDSTILPHLSHIRHSLSLLPPIHPHSSQILSTLLPLISPQPSSLPVAHHTLAILAAPQLKPVQALDIETPIIHTLHLYPFSAAFAHTAFSALQNLARPNNKGGHSRDVCGAVINAMDHHWTHAKLLLRGADLLAYHLHSGLLLNGGNGKNDLPPKDLCLHAIVKAAKRLVATRQGVAAVLLCIAPCVAGGNLTRLTAQVASGVVECMSTHIAQANVQILGAETIIAGLTPASGYCSRLFEPHARDSWMSERDMTLDVDPVATPTSSRVGSSNLRSVGFHPLKVSSSTVSLSLSSRTMMAAAKSSSSSYRKQALIFLRAHCLEALTGTLFAHQDDPTVLPVALRAIRCIGTAAGSNGVRSAVHEESLRRTLDAVDLAVGFASACADEELLKIAREVKEMLGSYISRSTKNEGRSRLMKGFLRVFGSGDNQGYVGMGASGIQELDSNSRRGRRNEETTSLKSSKSGKSLKKRAGKWGFKRARKSKKESDTVSLVEHEWETPGSPVPGSPVPGSPVPGSPLPEDDQKDVQYYNGGWDINTRQGPRTIASAASTVTHSRETSVTQSRSRNSLHF